MREANRERISGFLWGTIPAAVPLAVVLTPVVGYEAIHGNFDTIAQGAPYVFIPIALMGFAHMEEYRGMHQVSKDKKAVKVSSRRAIKDVLSGQPPTPPPNVEDFIREIYEYFELDALQKYNPQEEGAFFDQNKIFVEGFTPDIVSAHLAIEIVNRFRQIVTREAYHVKSSSEEREKSMFQRDAIIDVLKFGWKAVKWREKGNKFKLAEGKPYSVPAVAGVATESITKALHIKDGKDLSGILKTIKILH